MADIKKSLVVRVDENLHQQLKVYCAEKKTSISEVVIGLITKELTTKERKK